MLVAINQVAMEDESFNTTRSMATIVRASATSKGVLLLPPLNYSSVKRLIQVADDSVSPNPDSNDSLGDEICSAANDLMFTETKGNSLISVSPAHSLAALFDADSPQAKALKPRLFLALYISADRPSIVGILTACEFSRDDTLGTTKFTQGYLDTHSIPRLSGSNCLFVDVVSSSGQPQGVGALLVLNAYITVMRSRKYDYLCTIAVSESGRTLCQQLGFKTHPYRVSGTQRQLCWIKAGELKATLVSQRLRLVKTLPNICWRHGFTARTSHKRYDRC